MLKTQRKRRSDRTHLIYVITNVVTGEQYVGNTVKNPGGIRKTLHRRMQKHVQRALAENKSWALCDAIRHWGASAFTYGLLETIRGKGATHQREAELINTYRPTLNTLKKETV